MAFDLAGAQQALNQAETAANAYNDPNLATNIQNTISEQWAPQLQRSAESTRQMMGEFVPKFFNIPYTGMAAGTTAADFTPQQKMSVIGRELGTMGGELSASSQLTNALGGQMRDVQNRGLQALQMGQTAAADAYNRALQKYQLAYQASEAEKNRQQQERLARLSRASRGGGGGINIIDPGARQNWALAALEQAKGQGEGALYKQLRKIEAQYGGWDNMDAQQQQLLSPYWGDWNEMQGHSRDYYG